MSAKPASKVVTETKEAAKRIAKVVTPSPLELSEQLSSKIGVKLFFKREDKQLVHSFKIRGAANKLMQLNETEKRQGVLAASAGNHAQGVALAAQRLGIKATIVMPRTTPAIKVDAVRSFGAKVILQGDNYSEAYDYSQTLLSKTTSIFIHPFDDPEVVMGQGTIGREIMDECPNVTHIFVPVGGGGLIAGIAQYVKQVNPKVKVIGVEPDDSNAMQHALQAGKPIDLPYAPTIFADGVAVKRVGRLTFKLTKQYVDDMITVSKDATSAAMTDFINETRCVLEPAGALAIAGAEDYANSHKPKGGDIYVAICSGANISPAKLRHALDRADQYNSKQALFAVKLMQQPGALYAFCKSIIDGHNMTELRYRLSDRNAAYVFVGFAMTDEADKKHFVKKMQEHGYTFNDLSEDDFANDHLRDMIGGKSVNAQNEHLYQITLPERSGALSHFLKTTGNLWNISLFHYRSYGGETGQIVIGFEVPDASKLESILKRAGYPYNPIDTAVIRHFI